jgi:hypothetical protein
MFNRGVQRTYRWFTPAEFNILHSFVDVKQDIAKTRAFDVNDGANVLTFRVDLPPDDDGVFVLVLLFLLD